MAWQRTAVAAGMIAMLGGCPSPASESRERVGLELGPLPDEVPMPNGVYKATYEETVATLDVEEAGRLLDQLEGAIAQELKDLK